MPRRASAPEYPTPASHRAELAAAAIIASATVAFGILRLRYGINLTDEGLALAAPLRYSLGDLPFRDEVLNPLRWFDIMMSPVVRALPVEGGVLLLRIAALAFRLVCIGALVRRFLPSLGPLLASVVFAAASYSSYTGYWTPTYHDGALGFLCLALAAAAGSPKDTKSAAISGALAGFAFFMAIMTEAPVAALLLVTAGIAACSALRRGPRDATAILFTTLTATAGTLSLVALFAVYSRGLLPDLIAATRTLLGTHVYGDAAAKRALIIDGFRAAIPWSLLFIGARFSFAALALATRKHSSPLRAPALLAALFSATLCATLPFIYIYYSGKFFAGADALEGLCIACMALYPAMRIARPAANPEHIAHTFIFIIAVVWHAILSVISATGPLMAAQYTFPFFLILLAAETRRALSTGLAPEHGRATRAFSLHSETILCATTAALVIFLNLYSMHESAWVWRLRAEFATGPLRGIHSTRSNVTNITATADYVKARVKPGDFLLAIRDAALFNYLTSTRPALPASQSGFYWPERTRAEFVRAMLARGRAPEFVVQSEPIYHGEPIFDFVLDNYAAAANFGNITVWRAKAARTAPRTSR